MWASKAQIQSGAPWVNELMKSNEVCRGTLLWCSEHANEFAFVHFVSSFALWCFGALMYQRRSWLMSLEWSTLSLSCVWSRSEFSPFFPCQVRHMIRCFFSICVQLDFPSCCGFNPGRSLDQWGDVSFLCVCSDRSGSFDWMAHDPEKDLCAGPQLGSPHHCPHH